MIGYLATNDKIWQVHWVWNYLQSEMHFNQCSSILHAIIIWFSIWFSLLTEIRETLVGLLLPQQSRVKDAITEKLDIELIAQQAANNVLDVKAHGLFIIDLMGKLCAPVRDEVSHGFLYEILLSFSDFRPYILCAFDCKGFRSLVLPYCFNYLLRSNRLYSPARWRP